MVFWLTVGIIVGIYLDQILTIPPLHDIYEHLKILEQSMRERVRRIRSAKYTRGKWPEAENDKDS